LVKVPGQHQVKKMKSKQLSSQKSLDKKEVSFVSEDNGELQVN
jgi:hypothetical protein